MGTLEGAEQVFVDRFVDATLGRPPRPRRPVPTIITPPIHADQASVYLPPFWVLLTGLCAERDKHVGANALLTELCTGPHYLDRSRDRLVALAHHVPHFPLRQTPRQPLDSATSRMACYFLGSATPDPHPRMAELVAHQLAYAHIGVLDMNHRRRALDTAARLARL